MVKTTRAQQYFRIQPGKSVEAGCNEREWKQLNFHSFIKIRGGMDYTEERGYSLETGYEKRVI